MKERGKLPNEESDVVREYEAVHEEDFWSSWLREDERSEGDRKTKTEDKKKKRAKRGKGKRRKKRTKWRLVKEDVRVVFLWKPLKSSVKGEIWRVVEIFLEKTSWRSLRTCLIVSLFLVSWCVLCLM